MFIIPSAAAVRFDQEKAGSWSILETGTCNTLDGKEVEEYFATIGWSLPIADLRVDKEAAHVGHCVPCQGQDISDKFSITHNPQNPMLRSLVGSEMCIRDRHSHEIYMVG